MPAWLMRRVREAIEEGFIQKNTSFFVLIWQREHSPWGEGNANNKAFKKEFEEQITKNQKH